MLNKIHNNIGHQSKGHDCKFFYKELLITSGRGGTTHVIKRLQD